MHGLVKNLAGHKFGGWTAVSYAGESFWLCRCSCGKEKKVSGDSLRRGQSSTCGCSWSKNSGKQSKNWSGYEGLTGNEWNKIVQGARARNIPLCVTIKDCWLLFKLQAGRCSLSGLPIELAVRSKDKSSASLDRIDSGRGYTKGNIQWVHKEINMMKGPLPQERFVELCEAVVLTK